MDFEIFVAQVKPMKPSKIKDVNRLNKLLVSSGYWAETKEDGCHYLMFKDRFFSTEHVEKTDNYPHLNEFFYNLKTPNLILDGEINYPGRTSQFCTRVTGALPEAAIKFQKEHGFIHFTIWNILRLPDARWTHTLPYFKQREWLEAWYEQYVKGTTAEQYIHLTTVCRDKDKTAFMEEQFEEGKEGIILKKRSGLYYFGKKPIGEWVKIKKEDHHDLFIIGYKEPNIEYKGADILNWPHWMEVNGILKPVTKDYALGRIGSLVLGAYVNNEVVEICTCSGLTERDKKEISDNREGYLGKVVRISYMEKTEAGNPRHPSFENFHEGKLKEECIWNYD